MDESFLKRQHRFDMLRSGAQHGAAWGSSACKWKMDRPATSLEQFSGSFLAAELGLSAITKAEDPSAFSVWVKELKTATSETAYPNPIHPRMDGPALPSLG
jgi:hypothetical protein